ncbi:MAG: hypothetical protein AAFP19_21130, partial [Bacteroidota bacterium]
NRQRLKWPLAPGFSLANQSFNLSTQFAGNLSCQADYFLAQAVVVSPVVCVSTGETCEILVQTGDDLVDFNLDYPIFDLSNFQASGQGAAQDSLFYQINLSNIGSSSSTEDVYIRYFFDLDGNGQYDVGDQYLQSDTLSSVLEADSTHSFRGYFDWVGVPPLCQISAAVDPGLQCQCGIDVAVVELPLLAFQNRDTTACQLSPIDIGVDSLPGATYSWSPSLGLSCTDCALATLILPESGAAYSLNYTLTENRASGCVLSYQYTINALPSPDLLPLRDTTICRGDSLHLSPAAAFDSLDWWLNGQIIASTDSLHWLPTGTDTLVLQAYLTTGCTIMDTLVVYLSEVDISLPPDTALCPGESLLIQVLDGMGNGPIDSTGLTFQWSNSSNLSCTNCASPTLLPTNNATYYVTVSNALGCQDVDSLLVELLNAPNSLADSILCAGDTLDFNGSSYTNTGLYCHTFQATNGCDSTHCINLTVLDSIQNTASLSICLGDSVEVFGNWVTSSGLFEQYFTAANGCDSLQSIQVLTLDTFYTIENRSICLGDSSLIFGNQEMATGSFSQLFTATNGCDSTHQINLEVIPFFNTSETLSICQGDSVLIFGQFESQADSFVQTFTSVAGCDSIHLIILEVLDTFYTIENRSICLGESSLIFGNPISTAGSYSQLFTAANGCDSSHQINLQVLNPVNTSAAMSICEGDRVLIFGQLEHLANSYSQSYTAANGCDSTHTINLMVLDTFFTQNSFSICEGDSLLIFGQWEHSNGNYRQTFQAANGCDSTHQIALTVLPNSQSQEQLSICQGDSLLIFGQFESTAGTYSQVFPAANGCDSSHQIELLVLDTFYVEEQIQICFGQSAMVFGFPTSTSGIYEQRYTATNGCDSTHRIELLVLDTLQSSETISLCQGDSVQIFGQWETEAGSYSEFYTASNGCDSMHTISLSVLDTFFTQTSFTLCEGDSVQIFGQWEQTTGIYTQNYLALNGCDSSHQITLTVLPNSQSQEQLSICQGDSLLIFGQWEANAGAYQQVFPAANGCDSTHVINLSVLDTFFTQEQIQICAGQTAMIFGMATSSSGVYEAHYTAANSCDSTHQIELLVLDTLQSSETRSICEGDSVLLFGQWQSEAGMYEAVYTASNGCDSIHRIELSLRRAYNYKENLWICEGDSALIFGQYVYTTGSYSQSYTAANGCDSLRVYLLNVESNNQNQDTLAICEGDSIAIFGQMEQTAGWYSQTFSSANGCDSLQEYWLEVFPNYDSIEYRRICFGESTSIFGQEVTEQGAYVQLYSTAEGCDSLVEIVLAVLDTIVSEEQLSICEGDSILIFDQWEKEAGDYSMTFSADNGCDSTHLDGIAKDDNILIFTNTYDGLCLYGEVYNKLDQM